MNEFTEMLGQLINEAVRQGVPPLGIIGALEATKVELISNMLAEAKERQAQAGQRPLIITPDQEGHR